MWTRSEKGPAQVRFSFVETWAHLKGGQKFLLLSLCALAYLLCVAPTFSSNVLPHVLASVHADGSLNGGEIVLSIYLIGAVGLLTITPLLMTQVSWLQATGLFVMSILIIFVNLNNAATTIGHTRDANADDRAHKIERIHALDIKIAALNGAVNDHKYATDLQIKAADELVKSADAECHSGPEKRTRGQQCAKLEGLRNDELKKIGPLRREKDLTDELARTKQERESEGAEPKHANEALDRFVGFLALMHIVSKDQAQAVSDHKPVIDAITMELMAFVGAPSLIIGIFLMIEKIVRHRPPAVAVDPQSPAAVLEIAKPPRKRKAKKKVASKDSVNQWFKECVITRKGRKLPSQEARASYEKWCSEASLEPVNSKVFGNVLRDELGVKKDRKSGRVEYLNLGLRPVSLRVVENV